MQNFKALGAPPFSPLIVPPIANFWLRAWLGDNEKTVWSKSVATLLTVHDYMKTVVTPIQFVNFEIQTDIF